MFIVSNNIGKRILSRVTPTLIRDARTRQLVSPKHLDTLQTPFRFYPTGNEEKEIGDWVNVELPSYDYTALSTVIAALRRETTLHFLSLKDLT